MKPKQSFLQKIFLVSFGILCCVFFMEISLRIGGLVFFSLQQHKNILSIKQKGAYRILCLGESTTANQYPSFLEETLNQRNKGIKFSLIDKGVIGVNTAYILSRLESNLDTYHPDMVVTMMGINDAQICYYKDIPEATSWLFQHCKVYKFMRLIYMHIVKKFQRQIVHGLVRDNSYLELEASPYPNRLSDDEGALKKAIELNPKNDMAFVGLGWCYRNQGKLLQAEDSFKKAAELNPKNDNAYVDLGRLYQAQGKFSQAEGLFKKALELSHKNYNAYSGLSWVYRVQGKSSQAEDLFKEAIDLNPKNSIAYREISVLYEEMGKLEQAKEYIKKGSMLGLWDYNPVTVSNYRKIKEILDQRGIKLVCVQYPMRNVEPLKKIFERNQGVIFVDNESLFKEVVKKSGLKEVFMDMFGGDFGHCTTNGNRLLATNIANVILKEVFRR